MPKILAVASQKGGSGKTTVALNLACALAEKGYRVLIVDADPQRSALGWGEHGAVDAIAAVAPMLAPARLRGLSHTYDWVVIGSRAPCDVKLGWSWPLSDAEDPSCTPLPLNPAASSSPQPPHTP